MSQSPIAPLLPPSSPNAPVVKTEPEQLEQQKTVDEILKQSERIADTLDKSAPPQIQTDEKVAEERNRESVTAAEVRLLEKALEDPSAPGATDVIRKKSEKLENDVHPKTKELESMLSLAKVLSGSQTQSADAAKDALPAGISAELKKDIFEALDAFRPGFFSDAPFRSLDEIEQALAHVKDLQVQLDASKETSDAPLDPAADMLLNMQMQLEHSLASRRTLENALSTIDGICASDRSPAEKLDQLSSLRLIWNTVRFQSDALDAAAKQSPDALPLLRDAFQNGILMLGDDAALFRNQICIFMAEQMNALFMEQGLNALDSHTLSPLAALCLDSGMAPADFVKTLAHGTGWAGSEGLRCDLVKSFESILRTLPLGEHGENLRLRLDSVDMIFQGASREFYDKALEFKKALCPGFEDKAELHHLMRMTGREMLRRLAPKEKGNVHASVSARSFLLSPNVVAKLCASVKKEELQNLNFQLANVATLQLKAMESGLIDRPEGLAPAGQGGQNRALSPADVESWCATLGLTPEAAEYAGTTYRLVSRGDEEGQAAQARLNRANELFSVGFSGTAPLNKAGERIRRSAGRLNSSEHKDYSQKIFQTSDRYVAKLALDRSVADLTGIIDETRFETGSDGLRLNGELIDSRMTELSQSILAQAHEHMLGVIDSRLPDLTEEFAQVRGDVFATLATLRNHSQEMSGLGLAAREEVLYRSAISDDKKLLAAMKADSSLVRSSWPFKKADRIKVCRDVLAAAELHEEISRLKADPEQNVHAIGALELRMAEHIEALRGVDPRTLTHKGRHDCPDWETVRAEMLPRARALDFFHTKKNVNGVMRTEADLARDRIRLNRERMTDLNFKLDKIRGVFHRMLGSASMRQLESIIRTAAVKTFVDSDKGLAAFDMRSERNQQALLDQLKAWGLDFEASPVLRNLVRVNVEALCDPSGTLRFDRIKAMSEQDLAFAGKLSGDVRKRELREEGYGRLEAWRAMRRATGAGLVADERRRNEGIRMLMDEASLPGSGFIYERSRGAQLDTGSLFLPLSFGDGTVKITNTALPVSAKLKFMGGDSLMVTGGAPRVSVDPATGRKSVERSYNVLLKGSYAFTAGAALNIPLSATVKLKLEGTGGLSQSKGLSFDFKDRASCEAFLDALLDQKSGGKIDPRVWLSASRIQTVDESGTSDNLGISILPTFFVRQIGESSLMGVGSMGFSIARMGEVSSSVRHDAQTESRSCGHHVRYTLAAALTPILKRDDALISTTKTNVAKALVVDVEHQFQTDFGVQGVLGSSCMQDKFLKGELSPHHLRSLFLPSDVNKKMKESVTFSDAFDKFIANLPPTARLTVHSPLKKSVLEEVRRLLVAARGETDQKERLRLQEQATALLAARSSYEASRITVANLKPADISKNWSPGLFFVQGLRKNTFMRMNSDKLEIDLPK